jgi:DNA gyrase subunit A
MTGRPVQKIIGVKDGDALIGVAQLPADKADDSTVIAVTSDAQLIRFPAKTVRPQGPSGGGMAGMRLGEGAVVLGFGVALDEDAEKVNVFTVSDAHAGKFTPVADYPLKGRGGGGVRCQTFRKAETRLLAALVTEGAVTGVAADGSIVDAEFLQVKRDGPGAPVEGNPQQLYIR